MSLGRARGLVVCLPIAVALALGVGCGASAARGQATGSSGAGDPPPVSVITLASPNGYLEVPPPDAQPMVSAGDAVDMAWQYAGPAESATDSTEELALFDDGGTLAPPGGRLVWSFTYEGACVRGGGAPLLPGESPPPTPACPRGTTYHVIIDADTGEFVESHN